MSIVTMKDGVARHPLYRLPQPVTVEVNAGECVAIVGRNGSGKSMLVDMLTGRHPLLGEPVRYDFGAGSSALVSDNIRRLTFHDCYGASEGRYYYQMRWNQWENPDPLVLLSSGELRRHELQEVLKEKPRLLVLDNPFIGLDVMARQEFSDELRQLVSSGGVTLLLVLSRWDELPPCVTHVIEVDEGCVKPKQERAAYVMPAVPDRMLQGEQERFVRRMSATDTRVGEPVVEFQDVNIRYGQRTILSHLSLRVAKGEHWALSGENGCGKTTLLSIVCADNPQAYANDITLFGHRRGSGESIWDIKRHIGYVSPEMHRAYLRNVPSIDIVAAGLNDGAGLFRRPTAEQRSMCESWMEVFGIRKYADCSFLQLSGGEQRLVLLARAFVRNPSLLILDEPMHGLDVWNQRLVKDVIETYCQNPDRTLIMVTHYEDELPSCIDHRLVLQKNQ